MDPENTADSGMDMDAAVGDIASGLGIEISDGNESDDDIDLDLDVAPQDDDVVNEEPADEEPTPVVREMPKSWSKDKQELWAKLPSDAQEYYGVREKQFLDGLEQYKGDASFARELRDIITPYKALLASQGVDERQAVGYLLNTHYKLSQGSVDERRAAYEKIGRDLGLVQQSAQEVQSVDPALKKLQDELNGVKRDLTQRQQMEQRSLLAEADREIETFASDAANVHFNDVGQDMIPLLKSGASLKDAYEKAVWANPITRQKELNRIQTESQAKFKETAKVEGTAARRATSSNVRAVESRKAPTEPKGEMFADMADILAGIRKKSH
tara:strand:- start:3724 stop:4704 length:981 start_codon:yes stop_codon:yes gene_type:complete